MKTIVAVALMGLAAFTGLLAAEEPAVPLYRDYGISCGNPQGTGVVDSPHAKGPKGPNVVEKWNLRLKTSDYSRPKWPAPLYVDGKLYLSFSGIFYCIDPATGKILFERKGDERGHPVIAGNTLYTARAKDFVAEELESGKVLWSYAPGRDCIEFETKYGSLGNPLVTEDLVVFMPTTSYLDEKPPPIYALERQTGKLRWTFAHPTGISCEQTVFGFDTLYVRDPGTDYSII